MDATSTVKLNSGHEMPVIGLGTWQLNDQQAADVVKQSIELGYRLIDTSGNYGNQKHVGLGIKKSSVDREEIFVVNKVETTDEPYQASKNFCKAMGLEYIDLMLLHWPARSDSDNVELFKGLIQARNEGIVKSIGVSNFSEAQIRELIDATGEAPSVNQIEWSPFGHSMDMLEFCRDEGIVIQAYSPLTRAHELNGTHIEELADSYEKSPAQLLLRWNIQLGTIPIPKASSIDHLEENLDIFDFEISKRHMTELSNLNEDYSVLKGTLSYI
jgi:diketogulonate reductase-like aldo/keto reductase